MLDWEKVSFLSEPDIYKSSLKKGGGLILRDGEHIDLPFETDLLNGMRVKVICDFKHPGLIKTGDMGAIYMVYLNLERQKAIVGVNLDSGGAVVFMQDELIAINPNIEHGKIIECN